MLRLLLASLLLPIPALAEPPRVVTDIAPVHSLVSSVMQGAGAPDLLLPPGASPHGYALRPGEASRLSGADLVIWVGPPLTPWLDRAIRTLAERATLVTLLDVPRTKTLSYKHHGHDHEGDVDPHAWLDPSNARIWLAAIAQALSKADPANAATYRANAERAASEIVKQEESLIALLEPVREGPFVVYHDGFRYFQARFSMAPIAVIADGDAVRPGAARLSRVQRLLQASPGACVFIEPQIPASAVTGVIEGTGARVATLDPLGAGLAPGADLYAGVLGGLARAMRDCLSE